MKIITFSDYLKRHDENRPELTEQDIEDIITIVGHGCRQKTKARLRSILTYGVSSIDSYGVFNRLGRYDSGTWSYVAGQSYTDEIRTLRDCILGKV